MKGENIVYGVTAVTPEQLWSNRAAIIEVE
jgi:hypothetical protein